MSKVRAKKLNKPLRKFADTAVDDRGFHKIPPDRQDMFAFQLSAKTKTRHSLD
jgi:hypothetical protein